MKRPRKTTLLFVAIGLVLYAGAYYAAERLMYRTGDANPFFKIAIAGDRQYDWVILGASHAMPLDFEDFNAEMERATGQRILNLAAPGAGPLYNRFVLEHFLSRHRTASLLYVLDSFAFYSSTWNEERFADAKLLRRTPFAPDLARRFLDYGMHEGIDALAVLDYVSGFSKINNRERFRRDVWEGEAQFDRVHRPSAAADRKRIAYLYPAPAPDPAVFERYREVFAALLETSQQAGVRVVVIKMPVPARFHGQLPGEAAFDAAMAELFASQGVALHDFSLAMDEPRFYFDTDHLNRAGVTAFLADHLGAILEQD
ncbi:MAG: hypothetical protein OEN55_14170 [Alphaproteobacteria bacterium]|nr:hypothetical protein [Alphaproteobacteria bacterium]